MKSHMFHIGRTFCTYHVNGKMVVIGFALHDGFWDPNYRDEETAAQKGINLTDGKGPNLELGGIPYDYIPSFLLLVK